MSHSANGLKALLASKLQYGRWQWNNDGRWTYFDEESSQEIESKLKKAIEEKRTGDLYFFLSKGSFFGKNYNQNKYQVTIKIDNTTPFPYIQSAEQQNKQSYLRRQMRRDPELPKPIKINEIDNIVSIIKWEWINDDELWQPFDMDTSEQIENEWINTSNDNCHLNRGFFSARPNAYFIKFDRLSFGINGKQINKNTRYERSVRRVATKYEENQYKQNLNFFLKHDKHFQFRQFYEPLCESDFKDGMKCSYCKTPFKKSDLFKIKKSDSKMDDDIEVKENFCGHKHRIKYPGYKKMINDKHIIYLNKSNSNEHHYYAGCALKMLTDTNNYELLGKCHNTKIRYRIIHGNQPNGTMQISLKKFSCDGFENIGTIEIKFLFEDPDNENILTSPGNNGTCYLPNNNDGRLAMQLIRCAFKRKILFITDPNDKYKIELNKITFKTSPKGGSNNEGWKKNEAKAYFKQLIDDLKKIGVTHNDLTDEDKKFKFPMKNDNSSDNINSEWIKSNQYNFN